nr:aminopeptidase P family protein [Anaerolineae bacterium]
MDNHPLICEKLDQAVTILQRLSIDAWLTFVRETVLTPDPSLNLIVGSEMVWQSAFIITRDGKRIAIVGLHDAENIRQIGGYTEVLTYVQGISDTLRKALLDINPSSLALNFSENDVAADGLGHGMMLLLRRYLKDTPLPDRFISSEKVIDALRGQKSPIEIERIKTAIATTQSIFKQVGELARPGMSELEIANYVHTRLIEKGLGTAWDWDYCPTISCGPDSPVGHAGPQAQYTVQPGTLIHMDFGVRENNYCADLQRVWYVQKPGEDAPPADLVSAFGSARKALLAGFNALRPGARGWEIDEAARSTLVAEGYPEYQHAFGHHVGQMAHDGATVLGPRWERYGDTPYGIIEAGNIFAIELGVVTEGYGYVGLEENVLVTENGAVWLSDPQEAPWLI